MSNILPESLSIPAKTLSGHGASSGLLQECRRFGSRGIILHGAALEQQGRLDALMAAMPAGLSIRTLRHRGGEPTLHEVSDVILAARHHQADWIAAAGGGSIIDLAKAAAALVNAPHPPAHYHDGEPLDEPGLALIAVPTTAGTGAEATLNAVLTNEATGAKKSIRAPGMMASVVILDPGLLNGCPKTVIAASGMDALTQAIEAFTSRNATWLSDTLSLQAVHLINAHLEAVYLESGSASAGPLLTGSYLGGIALSFARLGVVHGLAHPLGALYHVPHGAVCAACLPHAIELNRQVFGAKYDILSGAVGGDLLTRIRDLMARLDMTSPFAGKPLREKDMIVAETLASGSTRANPKPITRADVEWLLARIFE